MDNDMEDKKLKDICGTGNPFSVPEGYFDRVTKEIMDRLPEKEKVILPPTPTTWQRIKPWLYLAAMFCVIMGGARYFVGPSLQQKIDKSPMAITSAEAQDISYDEEYLENELMNSRMDDYSVYCYLTDTDSES